MIKIENGITFCDRGKCFSSVVFSNINLEASFAGCLAGCLAGSLRAFFKNAPAKQLCRLPCRQPASIFLKMNLQESFAGRIAGSLAGRLQAVSEPPASTLHAPCTLFLRFLDYFSILCFISSFHDRWKNHGHFLEFHQFEKKRKKSHVRIKLHRNLTWFALSPFGLHTQR